MHASPHASAFQELRCRPRMWERLYDMNAETIANAPAGQFRRDSTCDRTLSTHALSEVLHSAQCEVSVLRRDVPTKFKLPAHSMSWRWQLHFAEACQIFRCILFHHRLPCLWHALVLGAGKALGDIEAVAFPKATKRRFGNERGDPLKSARPPPSAGACSSMIISRSQYAIIWSGLRPAKFGIGAFSFSILF